MRQIGDQRGHGPGKAGRLDRLQVAERQTDDGPAGKLRLARQTRGELAAEHARGARNEHVPGHCDALLELAKPRSRFLLALYRLGAWPQRDLKKREKYAG